MNLLEFYKTWLERATALASGIAVPYSLFLEDYGLCSNAQVWGNCSDALYDDLAAHTKDPEYPFGETRYNYHHARRTQHLDCQRLTFVRKRITELELLKFYEAWLADANSKNPSYAVRAAGLCINAEEMGCGATVLADIKYHFGDQIYPFGEVAYKYDWYYGTQNINPNRIDFVERRIKELTDGPP